MFDIIKVNSHDMMETYHYGDALLVKKTLNSFSPADVIYFEYPAKDSLLSRTFFIQRVYGLPGDSIELMGKIVYRNGSPLPEEKTIKHNYFIKTKNIKLDSLFKLKYHLTEGGEISDEFDYCYSLTEEESEALRKDSIIKTVLLKTEKKDTFDETCFPGNSSFKWNLDHYGKIYIPRMNDTLKLDSITVKLYAALISHQEKNSLDVKPDSIIINGHLTNYYVVKKNYFFVLGDNRDNANDSRIWGLLPENFIVGKVIGTLRRKK
jgi:signal peptidase I